jgi:cytochrome P450 family 110
MSTPNRLKTPAFFQQLQWVADPVGYMEKAAQQYPDIFTAQVVGFGNNLVFVNHPQAMQEILTNDRKKLFAGGKENKILQPLLGDYSMIMLDGDRHRKRRQLVMPSFHGDRMRSYGEIISNITEEVWSNLPTDKSFLARNVTQDITLQVMIQAVFGVYQGERSQQLKKQLELMANIFRSPLSSSMLFFSSLQQDLGAWSPWGKFVRDRQELENRIDILSLLMSAEDESGNPMTVQELRDELMTLLFAGYETTATALAWGLYFIQKHPEVQEKLLQELDTLGDSPDPMSIFRLPYLTAVCNETLRIHPVAMLTFPRTVKEPVEISGYALDPGTILVGSMYLTHQREDLYPEPKQFKPERFLERQFSPYEFIPFGGGVRRCVGEALAVFELKLVLATILSRYELALTDDQPEVPRRRGVTLAPGRGVNMMITGQRLA